MGEQPKPVEADWRIKRINYLAVENQRLCEVLKRIRDMATDAYIRPSITGEPLDIQVELARIAVAARRALIEQAADGGGEVEG